ncbi:MAG: DUF3784 domain-containing protein [Tidjanibacter sp.]|nr:DUF3784 domain-containing protein [Tidjanibacter sp.]
MEQAKLYVLILVAVLCLVGAVLIIVGKGDWLISGYNTASAEERAQYNIRRLRLVMAVTMLIVTIAVLLSAFAPNGERWLITITIPTAILTLLFSNTWAKN